MCKFCEKHKVGSDNFETETVEQNSFGTPHLQLVFPTPVSRRRHPDNPAVIQFWDKEEENLKQVLFVSYCPFCGRKIE